jgi:hypothetical protein
MRYAVAGNVALVAILAGLSAASGDSDVLQKSIQIIREVGSDGKGSAEASRAWQVVARADAGQLPQLLKGMDGANALARNWLRAAIDEILDRARKDRKALPAESLESFLRDPRHDPQARRLAYELIVERDKTAAERFLPTMLDDPSPELRHDAVAQLLNQAEKVHGSDKKADALPLFQKCLAAARDKSQIDKIARRLRELGHPIDLPTHFGFVMDWKIIGPFQNMKQKGLEAVYPPEEKIDPAATYDGKSGKVAWKEYVTEDANGLVDLSAGLGKFVEATAYAVSEFTSREERDAEIRIGCYNALKLWINGRLVLVRGDAFTGMSFDHYIAKIHLQPGKNVILLKASLDDPPTPTPKLWQFQLRVCDSSGAAILSTTRPAPAAAAKKS